MSQQLSSILKKLKIDFKFIITRLYKLSPYRIIISLTTIIYLTYFGLNHINYSEGGIFFLGTLSIIIISVGLINPLLLRKHLFWLLLGISHFWYIYIHWELCDNHHYLWGGWILAIWISHLIPSKDQFRLLQTIASLLIGLVFLFAFIQKTLSPDYLSGAFFYFTFLTDSRFGIFELFLPFDLQKALFNNKQSIQLLLANVETITLKTPSPLLYTFSVFVSWYNYIDHLLIAVSFLAPRHWFLAKFRDASLLLFAATIYPLVPVPGFATILLIMGYAQTNHNTKHLFYRASYLVLIIYIYLYASWTKAAVLNSFNL